MSEFLEDYEASLNELMMAASKLSAWVAAVYHFHATGNYQGYNEAVKQVKQCVEQMTEAIERFNDIGRGS